MIEIAVLNAEGRIMGHLIVASEEEATASCPAGWLEGVHDPATVYALNGQPALRPSLTLPAPTATVGEDWTVQGVPAGTEVVVDGKAHPEVTDGIDLTLVFPLARTWRLDLYPPFPWREAACLVEVTDAD